jgi:hypothetical protein
MLQKVIDKEQFLNRINYFLKLENQKFKKCESFNYIVN